MSADNLGTLGKYQLVRELARSNDIVYEAMDPTSGRRVAVKELLIPADLAGLSRRERVERFWREAKAAGRLSHPNVVSIIEVGKEGDRYFIAMEFLEGQNLRYTIRARGHIPMRDALDYTLQLCSALSYAHKNGVVHRDLKPENVQVLPGNQVKLTDFGIASLTGESNITQDGQVFGTPSYMSPEQVTGKPIDARSDIFSLGVLLYEMLTARKPFVGDSAITITYNILNTQPSLPSGIPAYIQRVLEKALAKNVDDRYSSVDEMARDLREKRSNVTAAASTLQSRFYSSTPPDLAGPSASTPPHRATSTGSAPPTPGKHSVQSIPPKLQTGLPDSVVWFIVASLIVLGLLAIWGPELWRMTTSWEEDAAPQPVPYRYYVPPPPPPVSYPGAPPRVLRPMPESPAPTAR